MHSILGNADDFPSYYGFGVKTENVNNLTHKNRMIVRCITNWQNNCIRCKPICQLGTLTRFWRWQVFSYRRKKYYLLSCAFVSVYVYLYFGIKLRGPENDTEIMLNNYESSRNCSTTTLSSRPRFDSYEKLRENIIHPFFLWLIL